MSPTMPQPSEETEEMHATELTDHIEKGRSAAGKELRKLLVVQKASQVYNGVTDLSSVTRGFARTVEFHLNTMFNVLLKTGTGQKADQVIANVTKKVSKAEKTCMSFVPGSGVGGQIKPKDGKEQKMDREGKLVDSGEKPLDGLPAVLRIPIELFFRFFPLCMFMRWFVHVAFLLSQATLALCKDLARPDDWPSQVKVVAVARPTSGEVIMTLPTDRASDGTDGTHQSPSKCDSSEHQEQMAREQRKTRSASTAACEGRRQASGPIDKFFETLWINTYAIFYLFDVYFFIPYLIIQTHLLEFVDSFLYALAGLGESGQDCKDRLQVEKLLQKKPEMIVKRVWIVDVTIDQGIGHLLRFPVIGFCLCMMGLRRPVKPFYAISRCLRRECCTPIDASLYLKDDPNYDESKDPDYVPDDTSSDDSLEYKNDDQLEQDVSVEATS